MIQLFFCLEMKNHILWANHFLSQVKIFQNEGENSDGTNDICNKK